MGWCRFYPEGVDCDCDPPCNPQENPYERGKAEERARCVAWLRERKLGLEADYEEAGLGDDVVRIEWTADMCVAIERGDHWPAAESGAKDSGDDKCETCAESRDAGSMCVSHPLGSIALHQQPEKTGANSPSVFEDALEQAFWDFDARHKSNYRNVDTKAVGPMSERDAFKCTVRALVRSFDVEPAPKPEKPRREALYYVIKMGELYLVRAGGDFQNKVWSNLPKQASKFMSKPRIVRVVKKCK